MVTCSFTTGRAEILAILSSKMLYIPLYGFSNAFIAFLLFKQQQVHVCDSCKPKAHHFTAVCTFTTTAPNKLIFQPPRHCHYLNSIPMHKLF